MERFNVLVIHRRTAFSQMKQGKVRGHFQGLVERGDPILERMMIAHEAHETSMEKIRAELAFRHIEAKWRHDFSGVVPDQFDLVITVGGDGTVLHASHAIAKAPILALNSSPQTSTGYFTAGDADDFPRLLDRILAGTMAVQRLHRMEVMVNGEVLGSRVLNDVLFSNECPASTTRYHLRVGDVAEDQVSSGVWVSTAAGSTAAARAAGGDPMPIGSEDLQYVVREPCPAGGRHPTLPTLRKGVFMPDYPFAIRCRSASARLFIDGPHVVVPVKFGDIITVSSAHSPVSVYGDLAKNKT